MPTSPNPLLWSFYRQIGTGEETGGMVHHSDARSTDLFLNAGVRDQNANVPYGNWEDASWGQVQEFYPVEYANFEVDQPFADNVYATGVFLNDPTNELYLHHYLYNHNSQELEEISKSPVKYKPVVPRPTPPPWDPPYLMLANGSRVEVMEARVEPGPDPLFPGDYLVEDNGKTGSAFYPDVRSAGVDLLYEFENGCILEYEKGVEFRLRDRRGTAIDWRSLRDMANTYGVFIWYAYWKGNLLMGIGYANVSYVRIRTRADNGVPGSLYMIQQNKVPGMTDEYYNKFKHVAEELTAPHL